jgi:hypothetical protein
MAAAFYFLLMHIFCSACSRRARFGFLGMDCCRLDKSGWSFGWVGDSVLRFALVTGAGIFGMMTRGGVVIIGLCFRAVLSFLIPFRNFIILNWGMELGYGDQGFLGVGVLMKI